MVAGGARRILVKRFLAARAIAKGAKAGAMARWVATCGIVGVSGAVVWIRSAGKFGVGFTSGCCEVSGNKDAWSAHIALMIPAHLST